MMRPAFPKESTRIPSALPKEYIRDGYWRVPGVGYATMSPQLGLVAVPHESRSLRAALASALWVRYGRST